MTSLQLYEKLKEQIGNPAAGHLIDALCFHDRSVSLDQLYEELKVTKVGEELAKILVDLLKECR